MNLDFEAENHDNIKKFLATLKRERSRGDDGKRTNRVEKKITGPKTFDAVCCKCYNHGLFQPARCPECSHSLCGCCDLIKQYRPEYDGLGASSCAEDPKKSMTARTTLNILSSSRASMDEDGEEGGVF